jgi:hypothetical protein
LREVIKRIGRHGLAATLYYAALRALAQVAEFRILRGLWIERPDPAFLECEYYAAEFLSHDRLRAYARVPAIDISEQFLSHALARGDECYGICDGQTLASYGWYAKGRTPISSELDVVFGSGYVYMYKGFTDDNYRGQRLHAIGMTRALQHYLANGQRGIVSYVESTNFDSLKSCFRMGYEAFGTVYLVKLFGRWLSFSSPGCRRFGFAVVPTTAPLPLRPRPSAWAK